MAKFKDGNNGCQDSDLAAFSIAKFCARHSISRAHYYNLRNAGRGPRELRAGDRVLITTEAAAEWRQAHTAPVA